MAGKQVLLFAAVCAWGVAPLCAQPVTSAKSGVVAFLEGKVYLDGERLEFSTTKFPPIKEGGVLKTEEGRAEVLLTPGVVLQLGENASLKMITNRLIDTRLELLAGSAVIEADAAEKDNSVTLVCRNGTVQIEKIGIYRFDAEPARVKVFKGQASVKLGAETLETTTVTGGKMLSLASDSATAEKFDIEDLDALDRWSGQRGMVLAMANPSAAKTASNRPTWSISGPMQIGYGMGCGWIWNPWYGVYTYVPCNGTYNSPYGYRLWSPYTIGNVYRPISPVTPGFGGGGYGAPNVPYATPGVSSIGSSSVASAPMTSSAPASTMGSTSSAASSAASAGHGSAGAASSGSSGGGRGH